MQARARSIEMAAQHQLQESPYFAIHQVTCEFTAGVLILRGQVPTFYYKQLAQEAILSLDDTVIVRNELKVAAPDGVNEHPGALPVKWPEL